MCVPPPSNSYVKILVPHAMIERVKNKKKKMLIKSLLANQKKKKKEVRVFGDYITMR